MAGGQADTRAGAKAGASRPAPGDEAAPGTPGSGENFCPEHNGSARSVPQMRRNRQSDRGISGA